MVIYFVAERKEAKTDDSDVATGLNSGVASFCELV